MDWTDDAIVLGLRTLGENGAVLEVLTREHGRHLGLVRGASSKRIKGALEPGNAIKAHWRARLDQQLGSFTVELSAVRAAHFFDDALKLSGLSAACAVAAATLPERESHTRVFEALDALLNAIAAMRSPDWVETYVRFEIVLLEDLGFGLDLDSCAATGAQDNLTHVSPKTGRAVSEEAAAPYRARLLTLPAFLAPGDGVATVHDLVDGLALTGFFLERAVVETHSGAMPPARARLCERLAASAPAR